MKKIVACLLAVIMITLSFAACGESATEKPQTEKKLHIVSTIFPQYDWVRQILGDKAENAELTMLLDNGVDLHSYQPTTDDIVKISSCDVFIYVGGESDGWVERTVANATNKDMVVINLLEVLGDIVKTEEVVEGMEHDHEHEDEHDHEHDENHEEHAEEEHSLDEHVWLSLKNTVILCEYISDKICELDVDNAENYKNNTTIYCEKLSMLDNQYKEAVTAATTKTLLFGDRFPFRYLVDDYNLDYFAAFSGCSAETEASFETVVFLSKKVDELFLKNIMVTESSDKKIAETIKENTASKNQQILVLDSMQSVTKPDDNSYLSIMESNLSVLKNAVS